MYSNLSCVGGEVYQFSKQQEAIFAIDDIHSALEDYKEERFDFPTEDEDLDPALRHCLKRASKWAELYYIDREVLIDPWGVNYSYRSSDDGYKLRSALPNRVFSR